MKHCHKCGEDKPRSEFHKNSRRPDGLQGQCKSCKKATDNSHYVRNSDSYKLRNKKNYVTVRELYAKIKGKPCADCGISYPPYVMDFDHGDGSTKLMNVSQMIVRRKSWKKIQEEIDKCELVCANCHRERGWQRLMVSGQSR